MARGSRLSLLGLYTYDSTLFDNFNLPSTINKSMFINNLLMECAEFEILYPDSTFMKSAIEQWSLNELDKWNKISELLQSDTPLQDINIEEITHHDFTKNETGVDKTVGNSLNKVNGWNDGLVDRNEIQDSNTRTPNLTNTDVGDTIKNIKGLSSKYLKQDIMLKELELRKLYALDDIIIDDFKTRFCLLIY